MHGPQIKTPCLWLHGSVHVQFIHLSIIAAEKESGYHQLKPLMVMLNAGRKPSALTTPKNDPSGNTSKTLC